MSKRIVRAYEASFDGCEGFFREIRFQEFQTKIQLLEHIPNSCETTDGVRANNEPSDGGILKIK